MERRHVTVQEGYELWAPTYDRDPNPVLALEERQLKLLLPALQGKRVLDLACGTGRWLTWLISAGARLAVGVDFSSAMLAVAKQKCSVSGRLVLADCSAISFPDAFFDLVVCSFAVGHISNLRSVALEVRRVTTATADVLVSDLHPLAYSQGWQTGFRDRSGPVEIAIWPRSEYAFLAPWISAGFDCSQIVACRFSESERQAFTPAGKSNLFERFCTFPAICICHFTRRTH